MCKVQWGLALPNVSPIWIEVVLISQQWVVLPLIVLKSVS